jgi:hypothetical protein
MRRSLMAVTAAVVLAAALSVAAVPASAHETAKAGDLALEVGWGIEPAYVGQLNTVQLIVTHAADGDPINDPGARLTAKVAYGDQEQEFALTPTYDAEAGTGTPGEYAALLIPTAPGDYTFHITGEVEGVKVDLEVASSPRTFSPVEDASAVQFPVKVPATGQVAERLDKELPRMATAAHVNDVEGQISSAKTMGYVGIAVGAVGIALAAVALLVRRRA